MEFVKKLVMAFLALMCVVSVVHAENEQVRVELLEYVNQTVWMNPLRFGSGVGTYADNNENQSYFNLTGYIRVTNMNPEGSAISDIYVTILNTTRLLGLPQSYEGRTGTFISNDPSSGELILHIPELTSGENSTWIYYINHTTVRPPLNLTSNFSATKVLAGDQINMTDTVENVFDNATYQSDTCIYNINLTQVQTPVNFSGTFFDYAFNVSSTTGPDASNVSYGGNTTQYWYVQNGTCLYKGNQTNINYGIITPYNIPTSQYYRVSNTTLQYTMNESISNMRVVSVLGISEANVSFEKKIEAPADPILYGSNVTWNVTSYFTSEANITYRLNTVTLWVSQRNFNGSYTDPNSIDNDSISNESLQVNLTPFTLVNTSLPWASTSWLFNYSDIPSPIVWMDINFTIENDGVQLINRSVIQNGNDIYIKELYLIIGYWLEIDKNITSIGSDRYNIRIDVHNKGNQVTPQGTIVTVYDFMPNNFVRTSDFVYSNSTWFSSTDSNNSVFGVYNGTLYQWAITPNNSLNVSLAQGPTKNENTTWYVTYNVTGQGDYTLLDVFITGLDPQKVDGAGSTKAVVVSQLIDKIKSTEGMFAIAAGVLLLLGLLA